MQVVNVEVQNAQTKFWSPDQNEWHQTEPLKIGSATVIVDPHGPEGLSFHWKFDNSDIFFPIKKDGQYLLGERDALSYPGKTTLRLLIACNLTKVFVLDVPGLEIPLHTKMRLEGEELQITKDVTANRSLYISWGEGFLYVKVTTDGVYEIRDGQITAYLNSPQPTSPRHLCTRRPSFSIYKLFP